MRRTKRLASVAVSANCQYGRPKRRRSSSATQIESSVGIIVVTPPSSPMRRATARTVGSGECPGIEPVSPSAKSTYSWPSTSVMRAPRASA